MCELFAMSSHRRSTLNYSLNEFAKHGGVTHSNRSGWGIAYYQGHDALLIKEPEPAADSPWVKFFAEQKMQSNCVIAHVRLATVGEPEFSNTHPFKREIGGHAHVFAHNGTLKGIHDQVDRNALTDRPIGETDSELGFCLLMDRMRGIWNTGDVPSMEQRSDVFAEFCHEMAFLGSSNFLYSDGEYLYAHGHKRIYEENGVFSDARPPGLSMRNCMSCQEGEDNIQCSGLNIELQDHQTVLFASVPLGETGWSPLPEQTVVTVANGEIKRQVSSA